MKNICAFCGGDIEQSLVTYVRERNGDFLVVENVPAGVCQQCGEREYDFEVAARLERIFRGALKPTKHKKVPVADFQEMED